MTRKIIWLSISDPGLYDWISSQSAKDGRPVASWIRQVLTRKYKQEMEENAFESIRYGVNSPE